MTAGAVSLSPWFELLRDVPGVVAAGTAVGGLIIARAGLRKWRDETVGRRRIELAEDVLADFYEARDLLSDIRQPDPSPSELENRPGREAEPPGVSLQRDTYFVHLKRFGDHAEFFARLKARRYRVIATFGPNAGDPYERLETIKSKIRLAAHHLMRMARADGWKPNDVPRVRRYEADLWEGFDETDEIAAAINALVGDVEARFRLEAGRPAV